MKSYELFALIPGPLATEIVDDMYEVDRQTYRAAMEAVAKARKVRTIFLERQPRTERHATMVSALSRRATDLIADTVLRTWLLKKHNQLLCEFLDHLKIKHEKGVVENLPESVEEAELKSAVDQLLTKHRPDIVALYLTAFNELNENRWTNLDKLLQSDPRLSL